MASEGSPARRLLCDDVWSRILDSCDRSTLGNLNCASRELFAILSAQRQSISLQSFVRLAVRCSPARLAYYCDFVRCVDVGQLLHLGTAGFDLGDCNSFSPTRSNSDSSNSDSDSDDYPTAYVDYRLDLSDIPGVLRAFPNATRVTFEIRHQEFEIFCNLLCTREPESPVLHATNAAIPGQVRLQITFRVDSESRRHPRNPIPALLHAIDNTLRPIADVRIVSLKAELDVIQLAINAPRFVELFCPEILVIETPRNQHYLPRGSYMKPADLGARIMHDNVKLITIAKLAGLTSIEVSSPTTVALLRAIAESSPRLRKDVRNAAYYQVQRQLFLLVTAPLEGS